MMLGITRSVVPRATISHLRQPARLPTAYKSPGLSPRSSQANAFQLKHHRYASSTAEASSSTASRIINFFYGATLVLGFGLIYVYITDTRASAHRWIVIPALRLVCRDAEEAHRVGNKALKALWQFGLYPRERGDPDQKGDLAVEVFGQSLRNPIGTSAGIDKHADIPDPLFAIGPAIIEIGGTTPLPQPGNEKPRVFRIASQNAMINRYGLNSEGADHVAMRLRHRVRQFANSVGYGRDSEAEKMVLDGLAGVPPGSLTPGKLLAVNIAKNKATPDNDLQAVANDYIYCVERLGPYADIIVVNVSSPNTPGLRTLQHVDPLRQILTAVVRAAKSVDRKTKPAVMVKVSPDEESDEQVTGICQAVWESGVDGVVVGNTTNRRPEPLPYLKKLTPLEEQHMLEKGGFSGPHLFDRTVALVKKYKELLDSRPTEQELPSRSPGPLAAEASRLKASIQASSGSGARPDGQADDVTASVDTGVVPPTNTSDKPQSEKQPLIMLPSERFYDQPKAEQDQLKSAKALLKQQSVGTGRSLGNDQSKVIFATGGIANGKQALEVLNAGASVAMVYTAVVYGGVGTISRIKDEMRAEMAKQAVDKAGKKTKRKVKVST